MKKFSKIAFAIILTSASAFAADKCDLPNGEVEMPRSPDWPAYATYSASSGFQLPVEHTFVMPVENCSKLRMYTIDASGHIPTDSECNRSQGSDVQNTPGLQSCTTAVVYKNEEEAANGKSTRAFKDKNGQMVFRSSGGWAVAVTHLNVVDGKILASTPEIESTEAHDAVANLTEQHGKDPGNVRCQAQVSQELKTLGVAKDFDHPGPEVAKHRYSQVYSDNYGAPDKPMRKDTVEAYYFTTRDSKLKITYMDTKLDSRAAESKPISNEFGPTLTINMLGLSGMETKNIIYTSDCRISSIMQGTKTSPTNYMSTHSNFLDSNTCGAIRHAQMDWNMKSRANSMKGMYWSGDQCDIKSIPPQAGVRDCADLSQLLEVCGTYAGQFMPIRTWPAGKNPPPGSGYVISPGFHPQSGDSGVGAH